MLLATPEKSATIPSIHAFVHPSVRPTALMVFAHPKPEPEIDGLKMECAAAAATAIVTCMHAAT